MENQTELLALQEQERIFTEQLEQLKAAPSLDMDTYNAINNELSIVHGKIEALKVKDQEVQTAVATAQTDIGVSLESFEYNGEIFSIYQFTETIEAANILVGFIQQRIGEVTAGAISYKQELEETKLKLEEEKADKTRVLLEKNELELTVSDLESKREAAANEILELKEENKQLKELRETVVAKPTNISGNAGQSIADWKAARPYIYNPRWKDEYKKNMYIANYAMTGEELEFSHLAIGKYNVITEEEALQFRQTEEQAQSAEPVQENPVPNSPLVEPPAFPSEAEVPDVDTTVGGEPVDTTVETVTRAEFEELKQRVNAMEAGRLGEVA